MREFFTLNLPVIFLTGVTAFAVAVLVAVALGL